MRKRDKNRPVSDYLDAPPSPCRYGCLPCNIYCFTHMVKVSNQRRELHIKSNLIPEIEEVK